MATATAVLDGVSSRGGTGTRRAGYLLLPPRTGEPTATSRVLRGSSSRRSEASEGAARGTDDAEGMGKKMVPAVDDMGGRGGYYRGRSSSSYGSRAAQLTRDHPPSPPVSSRRGGNDRKTRGGSDASSFVRPRLNDEQERLLTRAIFLQQPAVPQNIRPQAARHASLPDRRASTFCSSPPLID
ncbi:hypothetical protein PR202_gb09079 [Eleusine coracana subsp. coracana]|uniref:Uncharacterized protein n=1 Tax=Eleusine coracana subsp. coracana TaxID=191504 RepID=A0AAV5EGC2_ELECO|nr:hypothetical protein PR202_gb09079 [Eleusine coracana subsp. coracana]